MPVNTDRPVTKSEAIGAVNPTWLDNAIAQTTYYVDGRAYNNMEQLNQMIDAEYEANQPAYESFNAGEYVAPYTLPGGGYSFVDPISGSRVTAPGVDPGISLDLGAYQLSDQARADVNGLRDYANQALTRDAGRFNVDPSSLLPVDSFTYDPATADVYTTDFQNTFDPTRQQLDYANELTDYAAQTDGSHIGTAADLAYGAATGQVPSRADMALNRDANALYAAQMAMAARARGSSSAGLATMNAQNNTQLGYAQMLNAADLARAQEASDARGLYGQIGSTIRQGDLAAAGQAADIGQQLYQVNNSELGAGMANSNALNQGSQYNTGITNDAAAFNAGARNAGAAANSQQLYNLLNTSADRSAAVSKADDITAQGALQSLVGTGEADRSAAITGEQNYQQAITGTADRKANLFTGQQSVTGPLTAQREQAQTQNTAAIVGGVGSAIGALATLASDERMKNVHGKGKPADFSGVKPMRWSYNDEHEDDEGTEWLDDGEEMESGMANDMPEDIVENGDDGMLRVNMKKLMLRIPDALGDVQRRISKLEGKR